LHYLLCIALAAAVLAGCKDDGGDPGLSDLSIEVGDTLITIPAAAIDYAGGKLSPNHFSWDAYMLREYQVASNPSYPHEGSTFNGPLNDWKSRPWNERRTFLLEPYSRDINTSNAAQYYYLIGTYPEQFGYGWRDTYDNGANLTNIASVPWSHPADTTLRADSPGTIEFDGETGFMAEYRGMWVVE